MPHIAEQALKQYFGYDKFRDGQLEVIDKILNGKDTIAIMPTGAGKTMCYQIPAVIFEHTTIVISPLISLMKDQVDTLNQSGISCGYINSSLDFGEIDIMMRMARMGEYKLIYIAPERLQNNNFINLLKSIPISMIAVDEAHCVSQWGHDFRPSYKYISDVIDELPTRPVIGAFTATATEVVKNDILSLLKLNDPFITITGFDRPNLYFGVEHIQKSDKLAFIHDYVKQREDKSGIIYCNTRNDVELVAQSLVDSGIKAAPYHAGLSNVDRNNGQEDFIYNRTNVIVATNAFGMGIDKPDVRYVLHYGMPKNIESYYQEAGRAGRDGQVSDCIMLFCSGDVNVNKFLIINGETQTENQKKEQLSKLQNIVNYCYTSGCLRGYILEYFGEKNTSQCNNCSVCNSDAEYKDITIESQKILSCIKRMNEKFGSGMVAQVLRGSKSAKMKQFGFTELSTYGIMPEYKGVEITKMISYLVATNYLVQTNEQYSVLNLNNNSYKILKGLEKISMKVEDKTNIRTKISNKRKIPQHFDPKLFGILSQKRNELAKEQNLPSYIIFNDVTLQEMARILPIEEEDFLRVHGVGRSKFERYGNDFIEIIKKYKEENKNTTNSVKENTRLITYDMYKNGLTIEEISDQREISTLSIENHLLDCILMGLDVDGIVQYEHEKQVMDAISKVGSDKLKPIKEILPDEISYSTIKYFVSINNKK